MKKKVSVIFGTRPEAIKLAPLIKSIENHPLFECNVCITGQHKEMLFQVLNLFNIIPQVDLGLMRKNQSLSDLTARLITGLDAYLKGYEPDIVIVQGDTTTVFIATLAAFYNQIPIGHVEAGLRTNNLYSPWPEEGNRRITTQLSNFHFAPTKLSKENLVRENVNTDDIYVTGNTVIDALKYITERLKTESVPIKGIPESLQLKVNKTKIILITGHRRENFGNSFNNICNAIKELALDHPEISFIYPVHLNPNVREPVNRILNSSDLDNVFLIEPLEYLPFVSLMARSYIILTDSGGIQEEAPSLDVPVLVMRDTTEPPEAIEAGTAKLIGTDKETIVSEVKNLIDNNGEYSKMKKSINPYGDGKASERIIRILEERLYEK
ncbi:MAG TPA: UDP-N-acetylglucosamine 2-epimerase (non-hydrolyzing) [Bacteroidales bacterium]|nr:UDP-N-acetylglucosamine 2-epimerase (non-hydrolyzing) [Bacteroidales bacterium]